MLKSLQIILAWLSSAQADTVALFGSSKSKQVRGAKAAAALGGLLGALLCVPALATPVSNLPLDFSSIQLSTYPYSFELGNYAGSSKISAAINSQLPSGDSVSVSGAVATNFYSADGHVLSPTLANTAPGGIFIINNSLGLWGSRSDSFTISLTGFTLTSIEFDYEIFPDVSCPYSTVNGSCYKNGQGDPNWPDIGITINGETESNASWSWSALAPKVPGQDPQALVLGQVVNFPVAASSITFWDWPATIGIADVKGTTVPEPGTLALLAGALAGLWTTRRRVSPRLRA